MNSHNRDRDEIPGEVMFKKPTPGEFPYYEMPGDQLSHGASLSNRKIWVNTVSTGHIETVFCNAVGVNLLGSLILTYATPTKVLLSASPEPQCLDVDKTSYVLLEPEAASIAKVYPFRQQHVFDLTGELHVEETTLVPKLGNGDPPAVLQRVVITNGSDKDTRVLMTAHVNMQGDMGDDLVVHFNMQLGALEIYNKSHPDWVRIVGIPGCVVAYRTTHDVSLGYAEAFEVKIQDSPIISPGPFGELQLELWVEKRKKAEASIVTVVSGQGLEDARKCYKEASDFDAYLKATSDFLVPVAGTSMVETPDPIINQGVFWAKVNMLKVMSDYPQCTAFTNEPGKSTNVVGRDMAWFVYGCDFVVPEFSRQMLLRYSEKQYDSGKMPEYYNALDGHVEDYDISLNDDTPLYILACCHHYSLTHDGEFVKQIYPSLKKAANYILDQRDDRGLVISNAPGHNVWGIASWRNVVPNYQINGAVTEINSECHAALKHLSSLASVVEESEESEKFHWAAQQLRDAINRHLLNRENGLYYLNIDSSGLAHTDVTADEVFPVLFDVAPDDAAARIVSRLRADDFMTDAGLRTVSRNSPDYEPSTLVGLKGGVWPGVAFWYAFAASRVYPEYMVESLHESYLQYLVNPLKNNTVPGEFSEWFDGESLVNRGMRLSPWEPPRLLWAAVEGLCGVKVGEGKCTVSPTRPAGWKWMALRRSPHRGKYLTFFMTINEEDVQIYSNMEINTPFELHVVGRDVSNRVLVSDYRVHRAAFAGDDSLTICLGSEASAYTTTVVTLEGLISESDKYDLKFYSRAGGWVDAGTRPGRDLLDLAVNIENGEFRVLIITKSGT